MIELHFQSQLQKRKNPFGSSRVDHPFQTHSDADNVFSQEFHRIQSTLKDIKQDINHQSKGVVVVGEPGFGKTHLMMRLANSRLKTNRLLFIRQPNNPDAIIYHIYSRILESLIRCIPKINYTQLEYLIANSCAKIFQEIIIDNPDLYPKKESKKDQAIIELVKNGNLKLLSFLSSDTQAKREFWEHIENRAYMWWSTNYSTAGYAPEIFKGIIKFCGYRAIDYRRIIREWLAMNDVPQKLLDKVKIASWNKSIDREEVSLEVLKVLGYLSLLDEPLIIVFDQLEGLGREYNQNLLHSFGEAIKEIFTHIPNSLIILNLFPDRWEQFQKEFDDSIVDRISQCQVFLHKPSEEQLIAILNEKSKSINLSIEQIFTPQEIQRILSKNSIRSIINSAADFYNYKIHNIPLPDYLKIDTNSQITLQNNSNLPNLASDIKQIKELVLKIAEKLNIESNLEVKIEQNSETYIYQETQADVNKIIGDYLNQKYQQIEEEYSESQIITSSDDRGKLEKIFESLKIIQSSLKLDFLTLDRPKKIPDHLVIQTETQGYVIGFLYDGGNAFFSRMTNWNQLAAKNSHLKFYLYRDARGYQVSGEKSMAELDKFKNSDNGEYIVLIKDERITFELLYQIIVDIQNLDFEAKLDEALSIILKKYSHHSLLKIAIEAIGNFEV
ncbi:ATP-binding protein [Okeania sp. SIO2B3]|uniref:ATP-binding protein n=1 Tax=Okeania sp. SIO2B3 TaxID=2607784 RepID=UPI0013C134F1|nr:ATP-binding protein [Okeania sp. SIO2B3]NET45180.1 exonuclease [Okeania sp. SIO2B3]